MKRRIIQIARIIYNYLKYHVYVNETLILFEHDKSIQQESPARIVHITPENVADVLEFQHRKYIPTFVEFMRQGDTGYFAYLNGKCVHRAWVVHQPKTVHLHPVLPMRLNREEAFIHYCETARHARGRNIYPAVLSRIAADFKKDGRSLLISVNAKNSSSIKGIMKAGFKERERQRIVMLLGIKFSSRAKS